MLSTAIQKILIRGMQNKRIKLEKINLHTACFDGYI